MLLFLLFFSLEEPLKFGAEINEKSPLVSLADFKADPEKYLGKVIRVEGTVKEVCPKAGCWVDIAKADDVVRIKVKDGEIVFEQALVGKNAVAEGTVYKFDLNKEEALGYYKHLAEEKGETFDPSSVPEQATIYQIGGLGLATK